ncbi:MAG: hypothetical protein D6778_04085 [Nitrospirae bacterium]|nr:MAG: hypothetical protein D6778_04085 [Nitrospirota bacterium]
MKKVAVVVRDRQEEALRMAVGMTIMVDHVDVYVLDRPVEKNEKNELNLETLKELGRAVFTNTKENPDMEFLPTEEIAKRLLEYDHVIPY